MCIQKVETTDPAGKCIFLLKMEKHVRFKVRGDDCLARVSNFNAFTHKVTQVSNEAAHTALRSRGSYGALGSTTKESPMGHFKNL